MATEWMPHIVVYFAVKSDLAKVRSIQSFGLRHDVSRLLVYSPNPKKERKRERERERGGGVEQL